MFSKVIVRLWLILAQAVTIALAIAFVWQHGFSADKNEGAPNLAKAAQLASPSVVTVLTHQNQPGQHLESIDSSWNSLPEETFSAVGSGVIVRKDGKILTNYHVIAPLNTIIIRLANNKRYEASIVSTDPESDLAMLSIPADDLPTIAIKNSQSLRVGDPVIAIGNPFDVGITVTAGIVSAKNRHGLGLYDYEDFIQTDAAINQGNSGGPLINQNGEMVGLNTAIISQRQNKTFSGIGFAIPTTTIETLLPNLINNIPIERGYIGLITRDISPEYAKDIGLPTSNGVMITFIVPQGPAAKAALHAFDVIQSVNDRTIANGYQLNQLIASLKPGTKAHMKVLRGQEVLNVTLNIDERPPAVEAPKDPLKNLI